VFRCIFGAKQEKGIWRKRYNYELYEILNEPNIVNYSDTSANEDNSFRNHIR